MNSYCALLIRCFSFLTLDSLSQPGSVYVRRLTDKHSVYAHKATADISLLGVRMPPPTHHQHHSGALKASLTLLPEPQWGWVGEGIADTGVVCQKKEKEKKNKQKITVRIDHFFSLRVQMHTYPLAVALCLVSLVPSFPPSQCRTASCVFRNRSPLVRPFVHRSDPPPPSLVSLSFGTDI